jgi:hypothetical protein
MCFSKNSPKKSRAYYKRQIEDTRDGPQNAWRSGGKQAKKMAWLLHHAGTTTRRMEEPWEAGS